MFCNDCFFFLSAPEFDVSELEKLFSLNVPKPADSAGKAGGKGKSAGSKSDRITLVLFSLSLSIYMFMNISKLDF